MVEPTKYAEVRRILERYVVEVVERFQLCPWAAGARLGGEIAVEVVFGAPAPERWLAAIDHAFRDPAIRVAMIVAPELALELPAFRALRDRIVAQRPAYGIAEFHPRAALDLATPARLVPWLRRAPDPLLQCVPLALLDSVRATPLPSRAQQAQILRGLGAPPRDVAAQIAETNHATASAARAAIEEALDAIDRDRAAAYARVGLSGSR